MALSEDLIQEFTSVMTSTKEGPKETTCYGTARIIRNETTDEEETFVVLDGSDIATPATYTVAAHSGDRVMVILKNRRAIVIGNITNPVLIVGTLKANDKVVVSGRLTTNESRTRYNDTQNYGLTFDSDGIGACGDDGYWYVTSTGNMYVEQATVKGNIYASGGEIGGFVIDTTSIHTKNKAVTVNDSTSLALSSAVFSRTVAGASRSNLMFAIGSGFGVDRDGKLYANNAYIRGDIVATSLDLTSGYQIPAATGISGLAPVATTGSYNSLTDAIDKTALITVGNDGSISVQKNNGVIKAGTVTKTYGTTTKGINIGTDGMLEASNAVIYGTLYASSGTIGGWEIDSGTIRKVSTPVTESGASIKYTAYMQGGGTITSPSGTTAFGIIRTQGDNETRPFLVYYDGKLISTKGTIGGWDIGTTTLTTTNSNGVISGLQKQGNGTYAITVGATSMSDWSTGKFKVTHTGVLYATGAQISGTLTAGADSKIGPWNVTNTSIWYGENSNVTAANAYKHASGLYFGESGISIKDKFYVDNGGVPYCMGADLYVCRPSIDNGNGARVTFRLGNNTYGKIGIENVGTNGAGDTLSQGLYLEAPNGRIVCNSSTTFASSIIPNRNHPISCIKDLGSWVQSFHKPVINMYYDEFGSYTSGAMTALVMQSKDGYVGISSYPSSDNRMYFSYISNSNYSTNTNTPQQISFDLLNRTVYASTFNGAVTGNVTGNCSGSSGSCTGYTANCEGNSYYPIVTSSTDKERIATIRCSTQTSGRVIIRGQFNTTSYSTRYFDTTATSSDVRLKTDIKDSIVEALPIVNSMRVREFTWKEDEKRQRIGVVADELETLDPMLAIGGGYETDGSMNVKAVNSFYLMGYLIKAIQELSTELDRLKGAKT